MCTKAKETKPLLRDGKYITASTACGPVEGIKEDVAYAFRGIPYAVPPIDEDRWRPAQIINSYDNCWNGTLIAHNATEMCMQRHANGTVSGVEDCLTLDVITPFIRYENPLPVVVIIGAESITGDSPSTMRPSARYTRNRDVIFVRPNFRLGVHGFLALDALAKSSYPLTSGNYGLSDLIAALKWIKINIVNFGGNSSAVTIFGHRAGATLVSLLVSSVKEDDLFARAWVTSGTAIFPGKNIAQAQTENQQFMGAVNCSDADCLREKSNEQLMDAVPSEWRREWPDLPMKNENTSIGHQWLVIDGEIVKQHPSEVWPSKTGKTNFVIGTTAHESHSMKLYNKHVNWTAELVRKHVDDSRIGELGLTDEVFKLYPETYQGLVSMISDIRTICPLLTMARQIPTAPFYVVTETTGELNLADVDSDVLAIVGRYEAKTPEQRRYISAMQQLFYHFVSHGEMKQFDPRRRILSIGQDALTVEDYPNCDFWIKNDFVPRYGRLD